MMNTMAPMTFELTRRRFIGGLIASAAFAGVAAKFPGVLAQPEVITEIGRIDGVRWIRSEYYFAIMHPNAVFDMKEAGLPDEFVLTKEEAVNVRIIEGELGVMWDAA